MESKRIGTIGEYVWLDRMAIKRGSKTDMAGNGWLWSLGWKAGKAACRGAFGDWRGGREVALVPWPRMRGNVGWRWQGEVSGAIKEVGGEVRGNAPNMGGCYWRSIIAVYVSSQADVAGVVLDWP